jgi:hypothetical protein
MTEFNRRDRGKFPLIDPRFLEPTSRLPTIPELKVATSNNNYDYSQVFELLKQKRDEAGGIEFMPTETLNDRHLKMLAKNAEKKGNIPPYTVSAPADVVQSAINNLPVEMQTILMPDPVSPIAQSGISDMDTDIDREIERALAGAMAPPSQETVNADIAKLMGMEPQVSVDTVDPVTAAVEAAVGNGQPTTDDTILQDNRTERPTGGNNPNLEAFLNSQMYKDFVNRGGIGTMDMYTASDGTEFGSGTVGKMYEKFLKEQAASQPNTGTDTGTETPAQPDFMTQLNDLIAQMQLEQTAAVEQQQQQQQQQRQEQTAEMAQNYMIGQPAVGYNPYQSGQYQNNPYGAAGVPNMGGITSIPVPAPYQAPRTMT